MLRITKTYSTLAASTDGLANNVTASSGASFTLAATAAGDGVAHKLVITPSGSVTGNYTISGKDASGTAITETLATNTTNAVTSVNYYLSDIDVKAPSGLGAETVDIGWAADAVTPPIVIPSQGNTNMRAIGIGIDVTGTPAYSLQQSYGGGWFIHATIASKTAAADGSILFPVSALRLIFTGASAVTLNALVATE